MKNISISTLIPSAIAVVLVLILFVIFNKSGDTIAVLDYKKIITESTAVKKAGDYFSELQENYKKEIDAIVDQKEQVAVLERKQTEFAGQIEALDGYLNTTLEDIIAKYRNKHSIAVIFPKESAVSLNEKLDITNDIIKQFNAIPLDNAKIQEIITKALAEQEKTVAPTSPAVPTPAETAPVKQ